MGLHPLLVFAVLLLRWPPRIEAVAVGSLVGTGLLVGLEHGIAAIVLTGVVWLCRRWTGDPGRSLSWAFAAAASAGVVFGGGLLATMAKHSQIDAARRQAQIAQLELRRFQEELADADQRLHVSLKDIGGLTVFADYFIDGLITDWVVQSKIQNALAACSSAINTVNTAFGQCRRRLSDTETSIEQLVRDAIASTGEYIQIRRFARYELGQ